MRIWILFEYFCLLLYMATKRIVKSTKNIPKTALRFYDKFVAQYVSFKKKLTKKFNFKFCDFKIFPHST
jgi:hypothetical protein